MKKSQNSYRLFIFDLDNTLADRDSDMLYPDAEAWFQSHPKATTAVATNQGGIGTRLLMEQKGFGEPEKFPTVESFNNRVNKLFPRELPSRPIMLWCARFLTKQGNWTPIPDGAIEEYEWDTSWRKPAPGMLLQAMEIWDVSKYDTLMIGDSEEDRLAAESAGCDFMWAWEFFGREKPEA